MRLAELRQQKGIKTIKLAAAELGITPAKLQTYESGAREASYETLIKFADFYGVSIDYILGRAVSPSDKPAKVIPLLGVIRAGVPLLTEGNYSEEIIISQYEKDSDFALRVTGDSMIYAGIREGDIVLFQKTETATTGQIVAAVVMDMDCRATLKYFIQSAGRGRGPSLRAANPKYEDQPITQNHRIIGVFNGLIRTDEPSMHESEDLIARGDELSREWKDTMIKATEMGWSGEGIINLLSAMSSVSKEGKA